MTGNIVAQSNKAQFIDKKRNVILEGELVAGNKEGLWKEYRKDESGQLLLVGFVTYTGGTKNGPFKEADNDTVAEGIYSEDKFSGTYKQYYFPSGYLGQEYTPSMAMLMAEGTYKMGIQDGSWKYYEQGKLAQQGSYKNGRRQGVWKGYGWKLTNGPADVLFSETQYENGTLSGPRYTYYRYLVGQSPCKGDPNKNCKTYDKEAYRTISNYQNGVLNGDYSVTDASGTIIQKGTYLNGKRDHLWIETKDDKTYYYDYHDGKINGYATVKDKKGNLITKGLYTNGNRNGTWLYYFPDGKTHISEEYENGKLIGIRKEFDERGKLVASQPFKGGKMVRFDEYDGKGEQIIREYEIQEVKGKQITCQVLSIYEDSSVLVTYRIKAADFEEESFYASFLDRFNQLTNKRSANKHGLYQLTINDTLVVDGLYKMDKKDKSWTFYYLNTTREEVYTNGRLIKELFRDEKGNPYSGKFMIREDGKLVEEVKVSKGVRNGKTILYNSKGEVVKTEKYQNGRLQQ